MSIDVVCAFWRVTKRELSGIVHIGLVQMLCRFVMCCLVSFVISKMLSKMFVSFHGQLIKSALEI